MSEQALFEMEGLPVVAVEVKSAGVRLTERRDDFIARGFHPLANVIPGLLLHPTASKDRDSGGPRCGSCQHRRNNGWWKCGFYTSSCGSSDLRLWWPACTRYVSDALPIKEESE